MEKNNIKKITTSQSGSTLVELLVSLSIFAIFLSVAIGGFIQSLANQRLVLKLVSATDNMSLTLEQITREMRVGTNFVTGPDSIKFDWPDTEAGAAVMRQIVYQRIQAPWNTNAIQRKITKIDNVGNLAGTTFTDFITSNNVDVAYFNVKAFSARNPGPCRVNMAIGITATDKGVSITNYIQTTVSSRIFSSTCQ